jgi:bifunctional non-homologous end joining protein LigD
LRQQLEAMRQTKMPFVDVPPTAAKGALWVRPELVAEVQFSTWTADNLVRQASFKGLREDKKAAEVRREVPDPSLSRKGAEAGTGKQAKPQAKTRRPAPATTRQPPQPAWLPVTHPDKIVDPETGSPSRH